MQLKQQELFYFMGRSFFSFGYLASSSQRA